MQYIRTVTTSASVEDATQLLITALAGSPHTVTVPSPEPSLRNAPTGQVGLLGSLRPHRCSFSLVFSSCSSRELRSSRSGSIGAPGVRKSSCPEMLKSKRSLS